MRTKTRKLASGPDQRTVSHQLREAILADGRSSYSLGQAAEVDPGMIQRFLNRERGLTLDSVDRLGLALGLRLTVVGRSPGRGRPRKPVRGLEGLPEAGTGVDLVEVPEILTDRSRPSTDTGEGLRIGED